MRFLFNTYKQHHDAGLAAHQAGDTGKARMHYLMAAKYLCALAKDGEVEFKSQRLKKVGRLMEIAKDLEGPKCNQAAAIISGSSVTSSTSRATAARCAS